MDGDKIGVIHEQGEFNDIKELTKEEQATIKDRTESEDIVFLDSLGLDFKEV